MACKVLLLDIDSTISNLALMKISAFYKRKGYEVGFNVDDPDIIYASVIFSKNKHLVDGLRFYYPNAEIVVGGTGYDINSKLPDEIEYLMPDYSLYPDIDYNIGYTSRGCNRDCHFCIVPEKEGKFTRWQHPEQYYDERFDKIIFLDNNILLDKEWFYEVCKFCTDHSLKVWFTQGLDIRLLDESVAKQLSELDHYKGFHFAFDDSKLEPTIREKCKLLKEHGIDLRADVQFYVYLDNAEDYDDAVFRCRVLKEIGTNPFVMFNINHKPTKKINELRRWANRRWIFWSCDISEYTRKT
jgi:radical SAM superfamily enzyme YgiQ (UPF0313 family)